MLTKLERTHLIVFSEALSPCRGFLAVCTNFGDLIILRLRDVLRHRVAPNDRQRVIQTRLRPFAPHGAFCLLTWQHFLVCGTEDRVEAWSWSDMISGKASRPAWSLSLPKRNNIEKAMDSPEINSLCVMEESNQSKLFAGCGDNNVHLFDLESGGTHIREFRGHTDYIHSLNCAGGRRERYHVASGSEDGTVRLWDARQEKAGAVLKPNEVGDVARPGVGKWITTVSGDPQTEDWLICGGGPQLSNWHLTALRPTAIFPYEKRTFAQNVRLYEDRLLSVGSDGNIRHWHLDGQTFAVVKSSSNHGMQVMDVSLPTSQRSAAVSNSPINEEVEEMEDEECIKPPPSGFTDYFVVCGSSNKVDVCSKLGYVLLSMEL